MIQKGYPITWSFALFIIIVYIGSYVMQLQNENTELKNIVEKQHISINKQNVKVQELEELVDAMFEYMNVSKGSNRQYLMPKPWPDDDDSPLYNKKKPI